jgi:hypothetical protein
MIPVTHGFTKQAQGTELTILDCVSQACSRDRSLTSPAAVGESSRYDVAVQWEGRYIRVQVKSTIYVDDL